MPAPLKNHNAFEDQELQDNSQSKFQDFQDINGHNAKLKELIFFARIAVFSLITVLFAFVLLVMNLTPVWAFLFASLIGLASTSLLAKTLKSFLQ
ncbi:DUF3270 domain-containing protein [Streptococcus ictaluri]|uniref:PF11674 family protein n=1 Tax=Streptococcus ictaluri 707-05 TaxID=764299 RepID=G5K261_9STRE|nr:DUF3270 domain-containing protein [Streptococcus ictaluri]EHI70247.1 hypothetical protein STRIC_2469 [Streptococcus ictaluri 707-05]